MSLAGRNGFGKPLDFGKLPQITRLNFLGGATVTGTFILSTPLMALGGLRTEANVSLPNLKLSGEGAFTLLLTADLDASQLVIEQPLHLVAADGVSANINLSNPNNRIPSVTGSTGGGSLRLVTRSPRLVLNQLSTAGGSLVVMNSGGDIVGEGLTAGSIAFQAAGVVTLSGSFAAASGKAAAVTLRNHNAAWVLGELASDRSIQLSGGTMIISGTLVTHGPLEISDQSQLLLDPRLYPAGTGTGTGTSRLGQYQRDCGFCLAIRHGLGQYQRHYRCWLRCTCASSSQPSMSPPIYTEP